jgi:hypothetical protein
MNPTLKGLAKSGLSKTEIANLIEKHIGPGTNEWHCEEALKELRRLRAEKSEICQYASAFKLLDQNSTPCEIAFLLIKFLREEIPQSPRQ